MFLMLVHLRKNKYKKLNGINFFSKNKSPWIVVSEWKSSVLRAKMQMNKVLSNVAIIEENAPKKRQRT